MNIFVTGSSGFIGSRFLELLKDNIGSEDTVFLLCRKYKQFNDKRFKILIGELEDINKHYNTILKCEYFYHIAANAVFGNQHDYESTNYLPTKKIVDILSESKVIKNFIFLSTIGAVDRHKSDREFEPLNKNSIPSPKSKYGESKLKSEKYITSSIVPYTIIRPTWVYGKGMRTKSHINFFATLIKNNNLITFFDFPGKVSLIHVDDLAISMINCIKNKKIIKKIYYAETESLSFGEIFAIIREKLFINKKTIKVPAFKPVFKILHHKLPITINNLFIDYLYAKDLEFKKHLLKNVKITQFNSGVIDVIKNNPKISGYAIITGANSGIGFAIAKALQMQGRKLILIDINTDNLFKEFYDKKESAKKNIIIQTDLSNKENIIRLVPEIKKYPIYCLINNVGIGYRKSFENQTIEEIDKIISLNIYSNIYLTKMLLEKLKKDNSTIVNIASSIAYNPLPNMLMYSSTKAFISNWSESLTYELKDTNKVITFSPSGTNTNFQKSSGVKHNDGKGLKTPEYVASQVIEAINKNKTVVILDLKTNILLTISKFLPRKINIWFWGKLFDKMR